MNDRMRQQRRATDMLIRSKSRGRYGFGNLSEMLCNLTEALAPVVTALSEFAQRIRVVSSAFYGEPVNVIRCENCEFSEPDPIGREGVMFCNQGERFTRRDGYCHEGSRKDGDAE